MGKILREILTMQNCTNVYSSRKAYKEESYSGLKTSNLPSDGPETEGQPRLVTCTGDPGTQAEAWQAHVGVGSGWEDVHRAGRQRPCPTFSLTLFCFVY